MKKLFVFNNESNPYQDELSKAYSRIHDDGDICSIQLHELSIGLLKKDKVDIVIADSLPLEWVYILKGMNIVSLIFGNALIYHHESDIVIDYKGTDSVKYFSGILFSMDNLNFDISEVVNVIYKMKWDSDFFGFPIAFVGSRYLSDNIQLLVERFVKKNKIKLVEYLCNCHDDLSVKVAEKNGYHFTDIRITFSLLLSNYMQKNTVLADKGTFRLAKPEHINSLCAMTNQMYKDSRYFYDGNFNLPKINSFYSEWLKKAITGDFDHECYCYFEQDNPLGFCTVRYRQNKSVSIGLFGVSGSFAGRGIGKGLLNYVIGEMKLRGMNRIDVVTQGRNYTAQKLYQSVGFRTFTTELWYHKWVN